MGGDVGLFDGDDVAWKGGGVDGDLVIGEFVVGVDVAWKVGGVDGDLVIGEFVVGGDVAWKVGGVDGDLVIGEFVVFFDLAPRSVEAIGTNFFVLDGSRQHIIYPVTA